MTRRVFRRLPWVIGALIICSFVVLPLIYIVVESISPPTENWRQLTEKDPSGLIELLPPDLREEMMPERTLFSERLRGTLSILFGVLSVSTVIGVSLAWLISAYNVPFVRGFSVLLSLPLAIPSYIMAASYRLLTDDHVLATSIYIRENYSEEAMLTFDSVWKYSIAIFTLSAAFFPYVFLAVRSAFCTLSKDYLEVSKMLGHSVAKTMYRVALPLARPAILGGMVLVALETLNEYGAMKIIGINTLLTEIFKIRSGANDMNTAVRLAGCVMLIVFVLLCVEFFLRGRKKFHASRTGGHEHIGEACSQKRAWLTTAVCSAVFLVSFGLPVLGLLLECRHAAILDYVGDTLQPAWDSLKLTLAAAVLMLVAALFLGFSQRRVPNLPMRGLIRMSTLGYAIPGAILGVAILSWSGAALQYGPTNGMISGMFYTSSIGLVLAYGIRFLIVAVQPVEAGLEQIPESIDEASTMLRRGVLFTIGKIHLPLLRPSILMALLILVIDVIKELPLTLILSPYNTQTLAMHTYGMFAVQEDYPRASVPALILIGTCVLCILAVQLMLRPRLNSLKNVREKS